MAKETKEAEATATESNGKPRKERKPSEYRRVIVLVHNSIPESDFQVAESVEALANSMEFKPSIVAGKVSTKVQVDTETSYKEPGKRGRKPSLVDKDTEKAVLKSIRALFRDPETASQLKALQARSDKGEDVSDELKKLVGVS